MNELIYNFKNEVFKLPYPITAIVSAVMLLFFVGLFCYILWHLFTRPKKENVETLGSVQSLDFFKSNEIDFLKKEVVQLIKDKIKVEELLSTLCDQGKYCYFSYHYHSTQTKADTYGDGYFFHEKYISVEGIKGYLKDSISDCRDLVILNLHELDRDSYVVCMNDRLFQLKNNIKEKEDKILELKNAG
jgi:hypothetical protein